MCQIIYEAMGEAECEDEGFLSGVLAGLAGDLDEAIDCDPAFQRGMSRHCDPARGRLERAKSGK